MRSLLVVMLLVLAVSLCHAEETKTEYAVSVDTTKINLGGQVDQVAEALKKHMEGPMGMYYQAAVTRNRVVGRAGIVLGLLLVVIGAVAAIYGPKLEAVELGAALFVGGLVSVIVGGIVSFTTFEMALCPEYVAMNDILTKLGSIVN